VAYEPGSNRRKRAAGLKLWVDDWTGRLNATLFLPGWVYKFDAAVPKGEVRPESLLWSRREVAASRGRCATPSAWCRWSSCRTTRGC
jgi:hypothetical protein